MNITNKRLEIDSISLSECKDYGELQDMLLDMTDHIRTLTIAIKDYIINIKTDESLIDNDWYTSACNYKKLQCKLRDQITSKSRKIKRETKATNSEYDKEIKALKRIIKTIDADLYEELIHLQSSNGLSCFYQLNSIEVQGLISKSIYEK